MTIRSDVSRSSWRNPWLVVVASAIATTFGAGPLMVLSFGIFLKPVSETFGWERQVLASALFVATTLNAFTTPFLGRVLDRYGVRRILLFSVPLFALSTAAMGLLSGSSVQLYLLFGIWGLVGTAASQLPYVTLISSRFSTRRGLALGLGMLGLGIGGTLIPPLAQHLIQILGWRGAYLALGSITLAVVYPTVLALVRDVTAESHPSRAPGSIAHTALPVTLTQVMRTSGRFWALIIAVFLLSLPVNGLLGHISPILTDHGVPAGTAALATGVVGFATMIGRVASGFLVDRFKPTYVTALFFGLPAIGVLVLSIGATNPHVLIVALATIGVGLGAEVDLIGVLIARYYGLRLFGQLFGCMAFAFSIAVGIGPWMMSVCYDLTHSYDMALTLLGAMLLVSAFIVSQVDRGWSSQAATISTKRGQENAVVVDRTV